MLGLADVEPDASLAEHCPRYSIASLSDAEGGHGLAHNGFSSHSHSSHARFRCNQLAATRNRKARDERSVHKISYGLCSLSYADQPIDLKREKGHCAAGSKPVNLLFNTYTSLTLHSMTLGASSLTISTISR
jgi:hypothetical protein